ncbi:YPO3983 family protein [Escherichia coli]|uniref:YPO3983 family protein n=1 Tax=Escherichia coli TaxID=562 RepID=UPI000DDA8D6A|nr:YPO3983 family protein [Escherichia coli]
MNNILLPPINIPCTLFETISLFDDFSADDMQYGDMVEQDFLSLGLSDISAKVDPYRLIKYHFPGPGSINVAFSASSSGTKISQRECTDILFAEMKELAKMLSFFGQYKTLIEDLIEHFRYGNGSNFHSQQLNLSFHEKINKYGYNSPIRIIKECIENGINSTPSTGYQPLILQSIKTKLLSSRLNKFNGLGISVHDISAQKISLLSFQKYAIGWSATIHFVAQDHFGLDVTDIKNKTYSKYRFFRIWFFLQRHKDFAFKPFFTNFNTIERIENYL